jgi:hypothetical protein
LAKIARAAAFIPVNRVPVVFAFIGAVHIPLRVACCLPADSPGIPEGTGVAALIASELPGARLGLYAFGPFFGQDGLYQLLDIRHWLQQNYIRLFQGVKAGQRGGTGNEAWRPEKGLAIMPF